MTKIAFCSAAVALLAIGSAGAADMPMPSKAPAPASVVSGYNWTGCYLGAGGGYGMWNQENRSFLGDLPDSAELTAGGRGWFGTVQVGCDYQVNSNIVIGAFADYDVGSIKGTITAPNLPLQGEQKLKWSWAAGGRLGWLPFAQQNLMVFVSAGYTEARFGRVDFFDLQPAPGFMNLYLDQHTVRGWFIGTGYEYAIAWFPGLTWKTEYRFADYGRKRNPILEEGFPTGGSLDSHKYVHTVRSALVWRFNFGGPVVARY